MSLGHSVVSEAACLVIILDVSPEEYRALIWMWRTAQMVVISLLADLSDLLLRHTWDYDLRSRRLQKTSPLITRIHGRTLINYSFSFIKIRFSNSPNMNHNALCAAFWFTWTGSTRVQDICLIINQDQLIRIQVQMLQKEWSWTQNWVWSWVLQHCWVLKLLSVLNQLGVWRLMM